MQHPPAAAPRRPDATGVLHPHTRVLNPDHFVNVGISHHKAPVEVRERFALNPEAQEKLLLQAAAEGMAGVMVVNTCNRTELFAHADCPAPLIELLLRHSHGTADELMRMGFVRYGEGALRHLMEVTAGLDSQVMGDGQIAQQLKQSYGQAQAGGMANAYMHRLMQHALRAHKRIRRETGFGQGAASVPYAAVLWARQHLPPLPGLRILLIGAGKMGLVTVKNLLSQGATHVTLVNRHPARAEELATTLGIHTRPWQELPHLMAQAQLVLVATGADHYVVTPDLTEPHQGTQPRVVIDLSVPRNVSPLVAQVPGWRVVNLDELNDVITATNQQRQMLRPAAQAIIEEELVAFRQWVLTQQLAPTLRALTQRLEHIKEEELSYIRGKVAATDYATVELLASRIIGKILAHSVEHLRAHPDKSQELSQWITGMFKLEVEAQLNEPT